MSLTRFPELEAVDKVEELFDVLDLPYDRRVVAVHRTRLLRMFGRALAALQDSIPFLGEAGTRATLRAALRDAHDRVEEEAMDGERLPRAGNLVQLRRRAQD